MPTKTTTDSTLSRKWRRTRTYEMPVADPLPAMERVQAAAAALRKATAAGTDDTSISKAREELEAAQEAVAACYEPVVFHAINGSRFQELLAEHPPTDEGRKRGDEWNPATFQPALVAACCRDITMTPDEWLRRFDEDNWSVGDRNAIFAVALAVNMGA